MKQINRIATVNPHRQFNNSQKERIKRLKEIQATLESSGVVSLSDLMEIENHLKSSGIIDENGNLSVYYKR